MLSMALLGELEEMLMSWKKRKCFLINIVIVLMHMLH